MNKKQLRILIAPLDWGLGHVTRCVPIITHIQEAQHKVIFAGNNVQQAFIKNTFPNIECIFLEGYNVAYAKSKAAQIPKMIAQIPRLKKAIKREHLWLQNVVKSHKIDGVISDNRYGLFQSHVPNILLTHQLQIKSGYSKWIDKFLLKMHYNFIDNFHQCWVVDTTEDTGLSGDLAHPRVLPKKAKTRYIGLLSQCRIAKEKKAKDEDNLVLILLSGAEPQRSILSSILWKKAIKSDRHILFVEGSQQAIAPTIIPDHIDYHKSLSASDLHKAIAAASIVICRSGYSSLMDLIAMQKKAILIPTPGQTEQEYLAKRMHKKKIFMAASQQKFDIQTSLLNASVFPFAQNDFQQLFDMHQAPLNNWFAAIIKAKKA
ncbi:MAG: glycosyl transferase family 28 [Chitinophagaceae bacterium]|nr:glycosyl transferase family 28 [Chitinophagaceae bacterium]